MSGSRKDKNTEDRILLAAREVFLQKGYDGARMHQIAEEAGINKALLHYYFRNKERLFEGIFQDALIQLLSKIGEIISSVLPLKEKIEYFVESYIDFLLKHPYLPLFVIQELNRKPDYISEHFEKFKDFPVRLEELFEEEIMRGNMRKVSANHLISNIISMIMYPVIARPILSQVLFEGDQKAYGEFLIERKKEITDFVLSSIKPLNKDVP